MRRLKYVGLSTAGTRSVDVLVMDQNDNDPVFSDGQTVKIVRQAEGNRVGDVIGHVTATDRDEGLNAKLSYSIRPVDDTPDNVVDIGADSGHLVARIRFDYETCRQYR